MAWTDLEVSGDSSREIYDELFKTKIKGKDYIDTQKNIALLSVPLSYDDYIRGKAKQALRTNINKASKKGYYCKYFDGIDYIDDIMSINCSSDSRGGREMEERYTNRSMIEEFLNSSPVMFGTFTVEGKLIGYIQILRINQMFITNKILGHANFLDTGLMYYMISKLVESIIKNDPDVTHIMYAKYLVGRSHAGYTYFKERCGFQGTNIRFHLHYSK